MASVERVNGREQYEGHLAGEKKREKRDIKRGGERGKKKREGGSG